MQIKKIKMRKINESTLLATGDIVFLKPYKLECTLLDEINDGFIIIFDVSHTVTYVTRKALEGHFLKFL